MDPFTSEKLVIFKEADLRAEADRAPLRAALAGESKFSLWLGLATKAAAKLLRSAATRVWSVRTSHG